ncbi:iron-containing redox enzyme family protein [Tychonema sp. BBK16]|uniref:iron-containing redox enzyme family protein n=1 Tax=Tychonema sp. BBK16 TaxID=2699888 RepID=UPI001F3B27E9|nr:iron-containing redox enzyme family protein [Tychonema sp. BBK16]MCF6375515.1 iron-containing redox enzyme family protein [Tychonema sp. BBK16]
MQNTIEILPLSDSASLSNKQPTDTNYQAVEQQFVKLLDVEDLDRMVAAKPSLVIDFESAIAQAISAAYKQGFSDDAAHRFLQRVLYRINRLNLFWYDDLSHYNNERSHYLRSVRDRIEEPWQQWELAQIDVAALQKLEVKQAVRDRAAADVDPPLNESDRYLREQMTAAGYRHLLAIASFDGLVEASRLSRILGGAGNEIQSTLTRVLIEEYGGGRLSRKHSTYFAQMLAEFGMSTEPEMYFDLVPWEVLAGTNHNFLLTERKRHFLRYNGGLTYFEVAGPVAYRNYLAAAQRLGLSQAAMGYWELHIREDERHGRWMLDEVALPLADRYSQDGWELVLGYDQEKLIGDRAAAAVTRSIQTAEQN